MRDTLLEAMAAVALVACLGVSVVAEEVDWKAGNLEHLAPAIGTYRLVEVLADPMVDEALSALLPPDAREVTMTNLQVAGSIDFIAGYLVLSGNRPHHGGEDTAAVWIRIFDGKVAVILRQAGRATLYAREERFAYLPPQLRAMLATPPAAVPSDVPADVTWVR